MVSPSCHSKPVRPSFIFWTQIEIFWWNPRAFWPCIYSKVSDKLKAQKGIKDIVKIVHVTSQWFNLNFMKLLEYFLCANKTNITALFNNFYLSLSVFDACSGEYHNASMWCYWRRSRFSDVKSWCACLQVEECARMHHGTLTNTCRSLTQKRRIVE